MATDPTVAEPTARMPFALSVIPLGKRTPARSTPNTPPRATDIGKVDARSKVAPLPTIRGGTMGLQPGGGGPGTAGGGAGVGAGGVWAGGLGLGFGVGLGDTGGKGAETAVARSSLPPQPASRVARPATPEKRNSLRLRLFMVLAPVIAPGPPLKSDKSRTPWSQFHRLDVTFRFRWTAIEDPRTSIHRCALRRRVEEFTIEHPELWHPCPRSLKRKIVRSA